MDACLVCGSTPTDTAHWPYAIGMGRKRKTIGPLLPTLPLCRPCHTRQHYADQDVIETLIRKAPGYWRSVGEWEQHQDGFETWVSKRRYREEA